MKVKPNIKEAETRAKDTKVVKRKGRVHVINKKNPRFKTREKYTSTKSKVGDTINVKKKANAHKSATPRTNIEEKNDVKELDNQAENTLAQPLSHDDQ